MKRKELTHEEHLELAKLLLRIDGLVAEARRTISQSYGFSARETKTTETIDKKIEKLRSMLDTRYHSVTTNEQFNKQGHVYFGGKGEG